MSSPATRLIVSRFDTEQNIFYLKKQPDSDEILAIKCNLILKGIINNIEREVNTSLPSENYSIYRFTNPYLNAENDLFKVIYQNKSVGLIIPNSALESNDEESEEDFDEYKQAYKFYCIKLIIENYDFTQFAEGETIQLTDIIHKDSIYIIIYQPLININNFSIEPFLPSLAIKGYYLFPENTTPNVLSFPYHENFDLKSLIDSRFLVIRNETSIHIQKSKFDIENIQLLKLLYKKLLIENNNPLYRFLVLYQVIEFLLEKRIRVGINNIYEQKDSLNNLDFFTKMNEISNTRSIINSLFDKINFDDKNEITNSLKDFIIQNIPNYTKQATGDCLYDIRNLLFHDFKKVMEADNDGLIVGLVMQCETLIHNLINLFDDTL